MKSTDTMQLKVGRRFLDVPICDDEETTRKIAKEIDDRLDAIEERSDRVDSVAYVLTAALELAIELHKARKDHERENKELFMALEKTEETIRRIAEKTEGAQNAD